MSNQSNLILGEVVLETSNDIDQDTLDVLSEYPGEITLVQGKKFTGGEALVHVVAVLTAVTIPVIEHFIVKRLKKEKKVTVKVDGVEIENISEKNVSQVIKTILEYSNQPENDDLNKTSTEYNPDSKDEVSSTKPESDES